MNSLRDAPYAWDIYAEQMIHHGHGLPLWLPDPDTTASEVETGDVGWMKEGGFLQLFNARKSTEEQPVNYGVPEDYSPFNPPNLLVTGPKERISQSLFYGRTVCEVDVSGGASAGVPSPVPVASAGASFSFKCGADAGAFLMFSPKAVSTSIDSKRHIVNYMREYHQDWMNLADKYGLDLKEEELIFVSGTTKTAQWAVAAFQGQYKEKQGMVTADFSSAAGLNLSVSISNRSLPQPYYGTGPRRHPRSSACSAVRALEFPDEPGTQEPIDQCIFMHYYKMKRRIWRNMPMKAAAGPDELPSADPEDGGLDPVAAGDDSGSHEEGSRRRKHFDPVNDLLDYILQNSEAAVAIASDRDLYALFKDQEFPYDVITALQELQPSIELDEHGVGTVSAAIDSSKKTAADEPDPVDVPTEAPADKSVHGPQDMDNPPRAGSPVEGGDGESPRKMLNIGAPKSVHGGFVTAITYSADGKYAASGSEDATIILWDVQSNNALHKLAGHTDTVSSLSFSHDNQYLASGSNDEEVILWTVGNGQEYKRLSPGVPVHTVAYTPDGSKLIAGTSDGSMRIWDTRTYERARIITKSLAAITFIVFSSDGRLMATGGTESDCYIWELATLDQGEPKAVLQGHKGMVCAAAFSPDGNRIVTASDDGSARVWKAETGEALVILHEHTGPVWTVAFSPDGKRIASGSSDSTVKVCDSFSGERIFSLDGHDSTINAVQFSPGGQFIASAASDNTVRLWNAKDGSCVATFNEHSDDVTNVLFSPTDETLVSGSRDGTVRIRPLITL